MKTPIESLCILLARSKNFNESTVGQGVHLALVRGNTAKVGALKRLGEADADALVNRLIDHVRDGKLPTMGDVKDYVLGQTTC